jgi:hypothetical protein
MSGSLFSGSQTPGGRLAGVASLTIDGETFDVVSDASYDATTTKREALLGQSGLHGFSEMPKTGSIGATIRDNGSLTVAGMMAKTNATVVLIMANGKTVYGNQMFCTECSEVKTQEGTFSVKLESDDVTEATV